MAFAEPGALTSDAIKEAVTGKTVNLDTPLGTPITIVYKDNGLLSGTAGAALSIYLGASSDRGRWWVADGKLCQKFFKWLEGETSCLRIQQNGSRIAWTRDDGKRGTATIMASGPPRPQPTYGLGGADLVRAAQQKSTPVAPLDGATCRGADGHCEIGGAYARNRTPRTSADHGVTDASIGSGDAAWCAANSFRRDAIGSGGCLDRQRSPLAA